MDEFEFMSKKVTKCMIEVCFALDHMVDGPFKAGGITAIEELYFRITNGKQFDWEELKPKLIEDKFDVGTLPSL